MFEPTNEKKLEFIRSTPPEIIMKFRNEISLKSCVNQNSESYLGDDLAMYDALVEFMWRHGYLRRGKDDQICTVCFDSRGESNVLVQNLRASDGDSDTTMNDEAFEREISDLEKRGETVDRDLFRKFLSEFEKLVVPSFIPEPQDVRRAGCK